MFHVVNNVYWTFDVRGWLQPVVNFATPFRIPDFFLISGLFLSHTLHAPAKKYLDKKVLHFVYFYLLWLGIQSFVIDFRVLLEAPGYFAKQYLIALVEPTSSLWFVHMLAIFYVVTRLLRHVPPVVLVLAAFGLQTLYQFEVIKSEWSVLEHFCNRYVYFLIGFAFAPQILAFARQASLRPILGSVLVLAWASGNWFAVKLEWHLGFPGAFLLGLAGATAVCCVSALLSRFNLLTFIRYCGRHSIVIYLTYAIPMTASIAFMKIFGLPLGDPGTATAIGLAVSVGLPLLFHLMIKNTPAKLLYERPAWASVDRVLSYWPSPRTKSS